MSCSRAVPAATLCLILAWTVAAREIPPDRLASPIAGTSSREKPPIDRGFDLLYRLRFQDARAQFEAWQQTHPEDPLGYVADAASYLFEEFNAQQVLTSKFFLNDNRLLGGIEGKGDKNLMAKFESSNRKGRDLAQKELQADPRDADALFALATANGLEADYAALLKKKPFESLSLIRKAEGYAKKLLAMAPNDADAWFSIGATNYIIGSLPAYKRFFLWFGGIHGNKLLGMEQMQITAKRGHYLKAFAEIFLALAAMREKEDGLARSLLADLAARYPENPRYRAELERLGSLHAGRK